MANINDFLPAQYQKTPTAVQKPVPTEPSPHPDLKTTSPNIDPMPPVNLTPDNNKSPIAPTPSKKKKPILGAILLLFLLVGSIAAYTLMNRQQDTRQQAAGETICQEPVNCYSSRYCLDTDRLAAPCKEASTGSACWKIIEQCDGRCRNAQCDPKLPTQPKEGACFNLFGADNCTPGSPSICQAVDTNNTTNGNTGYMCNCEAAGGGTDCYVWRCNDYQPELCPVSATAPTVTGNACTNGLEKLVNGCLRNSTNSTLSVYQYTCPEMTWAEAKNGCPNSKDINSTPYTTETIAVGPNQSVCLGDDYCGVRQIDGVNNGSNCFVSAYLSCEVGEPSPTITNTPTNTPEPLMCRKIEILDQYNQVLIGDADQNFSPSETTIKFRCYASDAERVNHFEFAIIEPDGTITTLEEGSNTPAISEPYLITQSGDFAVECRICESATNCQPYTNSRLPKDTINN